MNKVNQSGLQSLSLDGTWWLRWHDEERSRSKHANLESAASYRGIEATVPGDVHLDAMREGWIEDPLVGTNCLAARWIEECLWSYRREFEAPPEALENSAWLHFEGLDLVAKIFINGDLIGTHHNAFYPCRISVAGKLRPGKNTLVVLLDSGIYSVAEKPMFSGLDGHRLTKPCWLRKPLSDAGFDWAPRLFNIGIFKSVRLEWTAVPCRADQCVLTTSVNEDLTAGSVRARQFLEATRPIKGELMIEVLETGEKASLEFSKEAGAGFCELSLDIKQPKLWWPADQGEQTLYSIRATCSVEGEIIGETTRRMGFRHVQVNQDPHPSGGYHFTFEVNGRKIFCKGSNMIPADVIRSRIDRQRYEGLIALAREAHFNFLRVWGGGLYEADDFFELCDQHGILVWQEFSFACMRYPAHDLDFVNDVVREATHNVRRLASHPCLIAWCGNNEIEAGYREWGYADTAPLLVDHGLYHQTLRHLVGKEDGTRYYQPSSPFSPHHRTPSDPDSGDQHPWGVGFANTDFRDYRKLTCRFPTEGGMLGPRALPTMLACLPEGPLRRIDSLAWRVHDNSVDAWSEPSATDAMTEQWLGLMMRDMTVEEFTYWGGLLHGEALSEYINNFRRRMFDSSGAVYWMFNDCWPATRSWTIIDYYLRRCPSFYPVRRAMQPVSVVVAEEGEEICIFGINETDEPVTAELRYGLVTTDGRYPMDLKLQAALLPNASTRLAAFPRESWPVPEESAAFAMLTSKGALISRHRLFLPLFKEIRWAPMNLAVRLADGRAIFESSTFILGVCLDLDGECALADNFFDVWPNIPYAIDWDLPEPPKILRIGKLTPTEQKA